MCSPFASARMGARHACRAYFHHSWVARVCLTDCLPALTEGWHARAACGCQSCERAVRGAQHAVRGCGEGWANHFSVHARKESALIIEFVSESQRRSPSCRSPAALNVECSVHRERGQWHHAKSQSHKLIYYYHVRISPGVYSHDTLVTPSRLVTPNRL